MSNDVRKPLSDTGRISVTQGKSTVIYQSRVDLFDRDLAGSEVADVTGVSPEARRLARRLRQLRLDEWPDARLTQAKLAKAFSTEEALQPATVSSWESTTAPKLPARHRL